MRLIGGARPTGGLHVGHLAGMLRPFLDSVGEAADSFFVIADIHLLTTHPCRSSTEWLRANTTRLVAESIGAGLDPDRTYFLRQSALLEQAQMYAIAQSLVAWEPLVVQQSYRGMATYIPHPSLGLLGYAVLEAADALVLGVTHMAVGEHNLDHARIAAHLATTLNQTWRTNLPIPQARTGGRNMLGLDGNFKMSKSLGNAVSLVASDEEIKLAVERMELYSEDGRSVPSEILASLGWAGDLPVGEAAIRALVRDILREVIAPVRQRAAAYLSSEERLSAILDHGAAQARGIAAETLASVRSAMGLADYNDARGDLQWSQSELKNALPS
jgi:tryptophanyl-tRNA synthetase